MDDLKMYLGLGGVPVIIALVEVVKKTCPNLDGRWYPLIAIGLGVVSNLGLAYVQGGIPYPVAAAWGILTGLTASGLFSSGKALRGL